MNFTGYLPDASKNEFCEDIPATGHTIIALDAEQDELRDMAVEIRIVKDVGGEDEGNADLNAVTVAYRGPRTYPTGTINFEHDFPDAGYFVGIVTVTGEHGERWVSRFPFSVGMSFMRTPALLSADGLGRDRHVLHLSAAPADASDEDGRRRARGVRSADGRSADRENDARFGPDNRASRVSRPRL